MPARRIKAINDKEMEQLIKKIQKLREWEHLGLITTTGNTSDKGLNEFLLELENEALHLFDVSGSLPYGRKLLISYINYRNTINYEIIQECEVDEFLKNHNASTKDKSKVERVHRLR